MYMYKDIADIFEGNVHPTWSIRDTLNQGQNILLPGMSGTLPKRSSYIQKVLGNISLSPRSSLLYFLPDPRVLCAFGNVCSRQHLDLSVTKTKRSKVGGGLFVRNLFFNRYVIHIKFNLTIFLPILAAYQRRRENGDINVETA